MRPLLRTAKTGTLAVLALCTGTVLAVPAEAATTLYVDKSSRACTDMGPGTAARPFCTLGRAATVATAGQTVLVATGRYAEQLQPRNSGTSGKPITFAAKYGSNVVITGGTYGVLVSGRSYITVRGFTIVHTPGSGIYVKSSKRIRLESNRVAYSGTPGDAKKTARGITLNATTDSVVKANVVDHNSDTGIFLGAGTTRVTVVSNESTLNARKYLRGAAGIDVRGPGNSIVSNRSHDNEDSGIQVRLGGDKALVAGNLVWRNGDHGIDVLQAPGVRVVGNTAYGNVTAGINFEGAKPASSGARVQNNIAVDNGVNSDRTEGNIRVDDDAKAGTVVDTNLVWLSKPGVMYVWGTDKHASQTAFANAEPGQEAHGIEANPRFVDAAKSNFRLQVSSPAVDSADSAASGQLLYDVYLVRRVDVKSVNNTGSGPRRYDDRGAVERPS